MIDRTLPRRLTRLALIAAVRGAATAAGSSAIALAVWWITHH